MRGNQPCSGRLRYQNWFSISQQGALYILQMTQMGSHSYDDLLHFPHSGSHCTSMAVFPCLGPTVWAYPDTSAWIVSSLIPYHVSKLSCLVILSAQIPCMRVYSILSVAIIPAWLKKCLHCECYHMESGVWFCFLVDLYHLVKHLMHCIDTLVH